MRAAFGVMLGVGLAFLSVNLIKPLRAGEWTAAIAAVSSVCFGIWWQFRGGKDEREYGEMAKKAGKQKGRWTGPANNPTEGD